MRSQASTEQMMRIQSLVDRGIDYFAKRIAERMPPASATQQEVAMSGLVRLGSGRIVRLADVAAARNLAGVPVLGFDVSTLFSGGSDSAGGGWAGVLQTAVQAGTQALQQRYTGRVAVPVKPLPALTPVPAPVARAVEPTTVVVKEGAIPTWAWITGGAVLGLGGLTVLVVALRG